MATRFYISNETPSQTPSYDGSWERTADAARFKMKTSGQSPVTINTTRQCGNNSQIGPYDSLNFQLVSQPLLAGTYGGGGATLAQTIKWTESANQADAFMSIVARIFSNDGGTLRGTLLSASVDNVEINSGTSTSRTNSAATSQVVAQNLDIIVLDVGINFNNTKASAYTATASQRSGAAVDLTANDADTGDDNCWFEFSDNFSFTVLKAGAATVNCSASMTAVGSKVKKRLANFACAAFLTGVLSLHATMSTAADLHVHASQLRTAVFTSTSHLTAHITAKKAAALTSSASLSAAGVRAVVFNVNDAVYSYKATYLYPLFNGTIGYNTTTAFAQGFFFVAPDNIASGKCILKSVTVLSGGKTGSTGNFSFRVYVANGTSLGALVAQGSTFTHASWPVAGTYVSYDLNAVLNSGVTYIFCVYPHQVSSTNYILIRQISNFTDLGDGVAIDDFVHSQVFPYAWNSGYRAAAIYSSGATWLGDDAGPYIFKMAFKTTPRAKLTTSAALEADHHIFERVATLNCTANLLCNTIGANKSMGSPFSFLSPQTTSRNNIVFGDGVANHYYSGMMLDVSRGFTATHIGIDILCDNVSYLQIRALDPGTFDLSTVLYEQTFAADFFPPYDYWIGVEEHLQNPRGKKGWIALDSPFTFTTGQRYYAIVMTTKNVSLSGGWWSWRVDAYYRHNTNNGRISQAVYNWWNSAGVSQYNSWVPSLPTLQVIDLGYFPTAAFSAAATLSATGAIKKISAATYSSTATLTAAASVIQHREAQMQCNGFFSVQDFSIVKRGTALLDCSSTLTALPYYVYHRQASMTGAGAIMYVPHKLTRRGTVLHNNADMSAAYTLTRLGREAQFSTSAQLTAAWIIVVHRVAQFDASALLDATGFSHTVHSAVAFEGTADLHAYGRALNSWSSRGVFNKMRGGRCLL